jgi:hypothetical protein
MHHIYPLKLYSFVCLNQHLVAVIEVVIVPNTLTLLLARIGMDCLSFWKCKYLALQPFAAL